MRTERSRLTLSPVWVQAAIVTFTIGFGILGLADKLHALAAALSASVVMPIHSTCCGFAGDRGFLHPELTHSATAEQVEEMKGRRFDAYLSSNRTSEVGMNLATGQDYRSAIFVLEELTRTDQETEAPA